MKSDWTKISWDFYITHSKLKKAQVLFLLLVQLSLQWLAVWFTLPTNVTQLLPDAFFLTRMGRTSSTGLQVQPLCWSYNTDWRRCRTRNVFPAAREHSKAQQHVPKSDGGLGTLQNQQPTSTGVLTARRKTKWSLKSPFTPISTTKFSPILIISIPKLSSSAT